MRQNIIRYTVKPERAAENRAYVRKVFDALAQEKPDALHYTTLELEDGVSFVHIVSYESNNGDVLKRLPAFRDFLATISDRCAEPPVSTPFTTVGAYRMFGG